MIYRFSVIMAIAGSLAGCSDGSDQSKMTVIDTSWTQVLTRRDQNEPAATDFYKTHAIRLRGNVTSIRDAIGFAGQVGIDEGDGTQLVDAEVDLSQADEVKKLKIGDKITVVCYDVGLFIEPEDCRIQP